VHHPAARFFEDRTFVTSHRSDIVQAATWTEGEKERAMAVIVAYENHLVFLRTLKQIILTSAAIIAALAVIRIAFNDSWVALVKAIQAGK
jgi:hypothetical protein